MNTSTNIAELKRRQEAEPAGMPAINNFNPDAWHAMQSRDNQLIEDQILHGYSGKEYVYQFKIGGTQVTGVSVVGARELAAQYGGIKARIVASVDKTGSLFVFKSFEPLAIQAQLIPQLADQEDFYEVVIEVLDIKTGNSIQVRKKETKTERRSNGTSYDRPHFDVIAESKAFRNGVLSIIPQSVIKQFEERALKAGNSGQEKTLGQLRDGALAFAAKNGVAIERRALEDLTYAQLMGLGNAAKDVAQFKEVVSSLGLLQNQQLPAGRDTGEPITLEQVKVRLAEITDQEVLNVYADDLPPEISKSDEFAKAFKARLDELKEAAKKK